MVSFNNIRGLIALYQDLLKELITISQSIAEYAATNDLIRLKAAYVTATALWARMARIDNGPRQAA